VVVQIDDERDPFSVRGVKIGRSLAGCVGSASPRAQRVLATSSTIRTDGSSSFETTIPTTRSVRSRPSGIVSPVRQFVTVLCIVGGSAGVVLRDTGVRITRGFKSAFRQLVVRGDKFLPYESIVAVQFHKVPLGFGRAFGYIQLSLRGGSEAKAGLLQSYRDENSVWWDWWRRGRSAEFEEARELILARISPQAAETKVCPDCAETVKAAALVCRFCGHRFAESTP
jgi:hypothetical protein